MPYRPMYTRVASTWAKVDSVSVKCNDIGRLVALSTYQQRALQRTVLKPAMLAAVYRDQLAQARSANVRLKEFGWALPAWIHSSALRIEPRHRLYARAQALAFIEPFVGVQIERHFAIACLATFAETRPAAPQAS
ncbi:hypothetical protein [Caballeronia sp. LZ035]|uniref:hypothetical protein n=1 Tax=Caballeronia sp. LZ035 TaxID=3038568 RepID=UPI00285D2E9F|nr:hypothetical protein [Caballeronia sp. LZ035]MDR5757117.1 hypothetical protein [Caballeronia sp. LZ035]